MSKGKQVKVGGLFQKTTKALKSKRGLRMQKQTQDL